MENQLKVRTSDNKNILRKPQNVAAKPKQQQQQQQPHTYHTPWQWNISFENMTHKIHTYICTYIYKLQARHEVERENSGNKWNNQCINTATDRQVTALTFISFSNQKVKQSNKVTMEYMLD